MFVVNPDALTQLLADRRMSTYDLGHKCGVMPSTIWRLAKFGGKARINTLTRISNALGVDFRQFVFGVDDNLQLQ